MMVTALAAAELKRVGEAALWPARHYPGRLAPQNRPPAVHGL